MYELEFVCVCTCMHACVHVHGCTRVSASLHGEEALVITCMIQTISRRVEKMHMDGRLCEFSLYPFIEIILEHLLHTKHYARLDFAKTKKQVLSPC